MSALCEFQEKRLGPDRKSVVENTFSLVDPKSMSEIGILHQPPGRETLSPWSEVIAGLDSRDGRFSIV